MNVKILLLVGDERLNGVSGKYFQRFNGGLFLGQEHFCGKDDDDTHEAQILEQQGQAQHDPRLAQAGRHGDGEQLPARERRLADSG